MRAFSFADGPGPGVRASLPSRLPRVVSPDLLSLLGAQMNELDTGGLLMCPPDFAERTDWALTEGEMERNDHLHLHRRNRARRREECPGGPDVFHPSLPRGGTFDRVLHREIAGDTE